MGSEIVPLEKGGGTDRLSKGLAVLEAISRGATRGVPAAGFMPARQLAELYLGNDRYKSDEERVDALIFHESIKASIYGFITGLGGLVTMPVTIPADVTGSWVIQSRMVAAIATIYNNDPENEAVWTMIFACMLGGQAVNAFKDVAIEAAQRLTLKEISKISGKTLAKINKALGARFITKFGKTGTVNLGKMAPIVGGPINATFNFFFCYSIGLLAKSVFGPEEADLSKKKLRTETREIMANAAKMTARTSREAVVKQLEERRQKKEIEELVRSLRSVVEASSSMDSMAVVHRKEMIMERGPEVRECLIVHAVKGEEAFREAAREILVGLCEPEDEVITRHLNSRDAAAKEFIFSVLEGTLAKGAEGVEEEGPGKPG